MTFVHPQFLYLAPLAATPILIHLLNRVRYRRMRWAAIDFLLTSERRAVRRAQLRQIILMAMRTLLLLAVLGALAQPIIGRSLASIFAGSPQMAVMVDASASMSAADASGKAFDAARKLAADAIGSLPAAARATCGTFADRYRSPFREPLRDHRPLAHEMKSAELTGGEANVPRAIAGAAESLARTGAGGSIWLLTDLQAGGWRLADAGAWEQARQALRAAGNPRIVITDCAPRVDANFSFDGIALAPAIPMENEAPKITATVRFSSGRSNPRVAGGSHSGATSVSLNLDGTCIDKLAIQFAQPGKAQVVFRLPRLAPGPHAGHLELEPDAVLADNRHFLVVQPRRPIPVLVIDGDPSSAPFEGAADFVSLAVQPPSPAEALEDCRSPFAVKTLTAAQLDGRGMRDFAAVVLADLPPLPAQTVQQLREYAESGGLIIAFPGARTDPSAWAAPTGFLGVPVGAAVDSDGGKPARIAAISQANPVTASLTAEGLDRVAIKRLCRLDAAGAEVLATTDGGHPFLVQKNVGKGRVYVFAVSCQNDFSNLPFTPVLLLTIHRAIMSHMVRMGEPPARLAFEDVPLAIPSGRAAIITPSNRAVPVLGQGKDKPVPFGETGLPGIYRLAEGAVEGAKPEAAPPLFAVNVPPGESTLERVDAPAVRSVLPGYPVEFIAAGGGTEGIAGEGAGASTSGTGFALAALALTLCIGETIMAWSLGRKVQSSEFKVQSSEFKVRS